MTLHFLNNGRLDPKQDLSTESVNKQILGTDSISTLIQALRSTLRRLLSIEIATMDFIACMIILIAVS